MSLVTVAKRSGYTYGSRLLRKSLLICSYFKKPEYGVTEWEELSRTSAFFIKTKLPRFKKYHIISAAHTTHPFLFPKFYPEEYPRFLKFISESDTRNSLQIRDTETGQLLREWDLETKTWVENGKDLVVAHMKDEEKFLKDLETDFLTTISPIELSTAPIPGDQEVTFIGHDFTKDSTGKEVFLPTSLLGRVKYAGASKILVQTLAPSVMARHERWALELGMCGGPVLIGDHAEGENVPCVGMVEARVMVSQKPPQSEVEADAREDSGISLRNLNDHTVVMSSRDILKFVAQVESDLAVQLAKSG